MEERISFRLARTDSASFTGEAYSGVLADSTVDPPTRVYYVRFAPRARTHWHVHGGTQVLLVQSGSCLLQREGRAIEAHPAGSVIQISPGERHWHGAAADGPMTHVALNLENTRTEWQAPVSDAEYEAGSTAAP
jgi:quercetin dioxygenase-like cupin family protein